MDIVRQFADSSNAILAVTNSSSANIVAFYWNGSGVEAKWIMRSKHTHEVLSIDSMNVLHFAACGIHHEIDHKGRIRVYIGLLPDSNPFGPLYIVNDKDRFCVVFKHASGRVARLEEIFMDIRDKPRVTSFCKCAFADTDEQFVETLEADMGPIASFL